MPENPVYESDAAAVARDNRAPTRGAPVRASTPTNGERLTRRRRSANPLAIDPRIIPPHMSYEFKRETIAGQPDTTNMVEIRENHWKRVPAERHPELATLGEAFIRRGDAVLYERPKYLTEEAQMEDISEALRPVQQMEEHMYGTKPGELTRDHPSVRRVSKVQQQWSPGEMPDNGSADP